jgi:hypothetical protein
MLDRDDPGRGLATEWLLTDGLGGYVLRLLLAAGAGTK